MIPTTADDQTLNQYVDNIVHAFLSATPEQREFGRQWYPVANSLALILGDGDARMGAGIIAALSPMKRWKENVRLATDAAGGNIHGHTGVTLAKVQMILEGADPGEVLPEESKTWNFYRAILDPDDPDTVVIDRHAHDVAAGRRYEGEPRGLGNKKRYALLALAYRLATRKLQVILDLPELVTNVTQATTWGYQIDKNGQGQ